MRQQSAIAILSLAALVVASASLAAAAQEARQGPYAPRHSGRPRIEVTPPPLLYRRCAAWYVLQNRPSGTVLFPQKHCWWVRG